MGFVAIKSLLKIFEIQAEACYIDSRGIVYRIVSAEWEFYFMRILDL